jgi:hypothetical protein
VTGELHTFRCATCKTVAVSPNREHTRTFRCLMCGCLMRFLFSEPITTAEQAALARRGPVFNPGAERVTNG